MIEVTTIGGSPGDDKAMPLHKVKFFGNRDSRWFGYWRVVGRHPKADHIDWVLSRGWWLKLRTWLRRTFR